MYEAACRAGKVRLGSMLIVPTTGIGNPRYIVNFPTKQHWRAKSQLADIRSGLDALVGDIQRLGIRSIAIPPLGCGNGGLDWRDVQPLIASAAAALEDVRVVVYPPAVVTATEVVPARAVRAPLTRARALLILLIARYRDLEYRLGRLEVQKLAYFLQEAGEPLRLNYVKHTYGPYADNLRFVLERLDGEYLHGYGDGSNRSEMLLLPGAVEAAQALLANDSEALDRLERVSQLISGFETPFGMELLASVLWITRENPAARDDPQAAVADLQRWNERKRRIFQPDHVRYAWQRLQDAGMLSDPVPSNVPAH